MTQPCRWRASRVHEPSRESLHASSVACGRHGNQEERWWGSGSKRTLIAPKGDKRYIRRDDQGQISESDDQGRSLRQDVKKPAKKTVPAGQGDKGDQKRKRPK